MFFSIMTRVNTNLHLIQSSLSLKVLNTVCVELVPVISFNIVADCLDFKTRPFVNVDCIMLPFVCACKHFLAERYITILTDERQMQFFFLNRPARILN